MKVRALSFLAAATLATVACREETPPASKPETPKAVASAPTTAPAPTPSTAAPPPATPSEAAAPADPKLGAFKAVELPTETTGALVDLGRMLYFENRLSKNQDLSCNSCHDLATYGVDGKPTSSGHKGQLGNRNSPTVYNAALHMAQFWDGRAEDLAAQAKGPVLNPVEMAMPDEARVVAVLKSIPGYADAFKAAFPTEADPITYENMAKAIAAFEKGLVTPSRFDKYLAGDKTALTPEEVAGFDKFVEVGCVTCHNGAAIGGGMYQKLGLVEAWTDESDLGRFAVTKADADKLFFKVPSLRNIEKTAPYFHNGKVPTLDEAVKLMAKHQLGKALTDTDVAAIGTFLKTLTGDVPATYVAKPVLPASGPDTPKPDPT